MYTLYLKINTFTIQIFFLHLLFSIFFFFGVLIIVCMWLQCSIQYFFEQIQMVFECTSLFEQDPRMCFEKATPNNFIKIIIMSGRYCRWFTNS